MNRKMICISGVTGIGKSSVIKILLENHNFAFSISTTTRQPREKEEHAQHYYFVTKEEFEEKIQQGHFLEYTLYAGNYYGTDKEQLNLYQNKHLVFDLDLEISGLIDHQSFENVTNILLEHDDRNVIKQRLLDRSKDDINHGLDYRLNQILTRVYDHEKYHHIINVTNKSPQDIVNEILKLIDL